MKIDKENAMHVEAKIDINGHRLTDAESATVRVAVESLATLLADSQFALGDDEHGKQMSVNYLARINDLRKILYKSE